MTFDRRKEFRPDTGEAPFALNEVFFSRTDARGVIQAGNYVFHRVAGFDWHEMIGAPHRIIRHPDMPRAVFWLLWDQIKQGKPVGAYVKNKAKDGLYYWVFALVAPCEDGYLSARIKPTSALRDVIEQEYKALRDWELAEKPEPEVSAQKLLARLGELGFSDYDHFASHALSEEMIARNAGLGLPPDDRVSRFGTMLDSAEALGEETRGLVEQFNTMRTIPHNMRVIGSRLEPSGGPVSTLSQNYGAISAEMSAWFETNVVGPDSNFAAITNSVNQSMLMGGIARILKECDAQLNRERRKLGKIDMAHERSILNALVLHQGQLSAAALARVREESDRILRACDTMNRHVLGLSSTRVLCKIESARLHGAGDGLSDIIAQLKVFQERIGTRLDRISQFSQTILDLAG